MKNLNRQLNGTTFLSLEHWSYMVLVVLVPVLLLVAFDAALALWTNRPTEFLALAMPSITGMHSANVDVTMATGTAASLLVLAPLLFVLRRRTQAEMIKRPTFKDRLAYKLPIYSTLSLLAVLKTVAFITLVAVVLQSLTQIGVQGADVGALYTEQFLPALVALAVFGATSWYVFKLAKGRDWGNQYAFVITWVSALMVVTLFTTAMMATHNQKNDDDNRRGPLQSSPYKYWRE